MALRPPDVARLFTLGAAHPSWRGQVGTVTALPSAVVSLPTGQVAACDPFVELGDDVLPFAVLVEPGKYRVVLSVIETTDPATTALRPDSRVAAAMLQISEEPAVGWELALCDGQDEELGDTEFFGYGVDAGTGCFVDASATIPLGDLVGDDGGEIAEALYAGPGLLPVAITDPDSGNDVVVFPSGFGDGTYPTWIGRTASGEVTSFVTEFFVVPQDSRGPIDED